MTVQPLMVPTELDRWGHELAHLSQRSVHRVTFPSISGIPVQWAVKMRDRWRDHVPVRWNSRGIGLDGTPGCFVCGAERRNPTANDYMHNIAAHVAKVDEEASLACFERGARMGYYHADRNAPQIKVGACDDHLPELEELSRQWFISFDRVADLARWGRKRLEPR